ncbi:MAG: hypothetical protein AAGA96_01360 [Verrucomicrobiota bacterium]
MPCFSESLFWDVSSESINWTAHRRFVIGRVLNRGKWSDWQSLKQLYSLEVIEEEVTVVSDSCRFCISLPS